MINEHDIKRLALVIAVQAELEGMRVENLEREVAGFNLAYTEADFFDKAKELRDLASKHNDQL